MKCAIKTRKENKPSVVGPVVKVDGGIVVTDNKTQSCLLTFSLHIKYVFTCLNVVSTDHGLKMLAPLQKEDKVNINK